VFKSPIPGLLTNFFPSIIDCKSQQTKIVRAINLKHKKEDAMIEKSNFNCEGRLVALDMYGCPFEPLNSPSFLLTEAKRAAEIASMHVLAISIVPFYPQGLSINVTLAESHLCLHSYPELGFISADVYTCGHGDPMKAAQHLMKVLSPKVAKVRSQRRGILPSAKKEENHPSSTGELPCLSELRPA